MIYLIIFCLGIVFIVGSAVLKKNYPESAEAWFDVGLSFVIIILIVYLITVLSVFRMPARLQSLHTSLEAQRTYIVSLPKVPVDSTVSPAGISIDLPNTEIGKDVVGQTLRFWDKVMAYNESVYFWKEYSRLDFWLWGFPRIASKIARLPLITSSFSP